MNKIFLLPLALILLASVVSASCGFQSSNQNLVVYDFIEPRGEGADCNVTLTQNGDYHSTSTMTRQGLYYSKTYSDLASVENYEAIISCNLSGTKYYSSCDMQEESQNNSWVLIIIILIIMTSLVVLTFMYARVFPHIHFVSVPIILGCIYLLARIALGASSGTSLLNVANTFFQTTNYLVIFIALYAFVMLAWYFFAGANKTIWGKNK